MPLSADASALTLVRELHELIPLYARWASSKIPKDGLTPARMRVLLTLKDHGSSLMREIKDCLHTSATNITGLVDGLEAEGLVVREVDPEDRRVFRIALTPEGLRRCTEEWSRYEALCAKTFEDMDPGRLADLAKTLVELREQLKAD